MYSIELSGEETARLNMGVLIAWGISLNMRIL